MLVFILKELVFVIKLWVIVNPRKRRGVFRCSSSPFYFPHFFGSTERKDLQNDCSFKCLRKCLNEQAAFLNVVEMASRIVFFLIKKGRQNSMFENSFLKLSLCNNPVPKWSIFQKMRKIAELNVSDNLEGTMHKKPPSTLPSSCSKIVL